MGSKTFRALFIAVLCLTGCGDYQPAPSLPPDYDMPPPPVIVARIVERYDSGARCGEEAYSGNEKTGLWLYWYENGKLKSKGTYDKGQVTGLWIGWTDSSSISAGGTYFDGKRTGP